MCVNMHTLYIYNVYNLYIHTQNDKHIKYMCVYTCIVYICTYAYIIYYMFNVINEIHAIGLKCSLHIFYIRSLTLYLKTMFICIEHVCIVSVPWGLYYWEMEDNKWISIIITQTILEKEMCLVESKAV